VRSRRSCQSRRFLPAAGTHLGEGDKRHRTGEDLRDEVRPARPEDEADERHDRELPEAQRLRHVRVLEAHVEQAGHPGERRDHDEQRAAASQNGTPFSA
jgi:hypothetical protein